METEENNNFFDAKEKEIANKTQSQNKENKIHKDGLKLQRQTLYHHVHNAKRMATTNS